MIKYKPQVVHFSEDIILKYYIDKKYNYYWTNIPEKDFLDFIYYSSSPSKIIITEKYILFIFRFMTIRIPLNKQSLELIKGKINVNDNSSQKRVS